MKITDVSGAIAILSAGLACMATAAVAADHGLFPAVGTYDASDAKFERLLTVAPGGKFTLEVMEKGAPGHLRSGAGEGALSDAPGGWRYSEGRCVLSLKRAAGGLQLHAETCASAWGDVPFDGKYLLQGVHAASMPAKTPVAGPASPAGLPSRRELGELWTNIDVGSVAGKSVLVMVRSAGTGTPGSVLERFSNAAYVVDTTSDYERLSSAEKAKPPLRIVAIPLPVIGAREGLEFEVDCSDGTSEDIVAINVARQDKGNQVTRRRVSAWRLDARFQPLEIKPASKVECPPAAGY